MFKRLADFLLHGQFNAAVVGFILSTAAAFHWPTQYLAFFLVVLVTMCNGVKPGFKVLAWILLPALGLAALHRAPVWVDQGAVECTVLWLSSAIIASGLGWSWVITTLTLIGLACIAITHYAVANLALWWQTQISQTMSVFAQNLDISSQSVQNQIVILSHMATGMFIAISMSLLVLCLILGRAAQSQLDCRIQPRQELYHLRANKALLALSLCSIAALFFPAITARYDVAVLLAVSMSYFGLSFIHFQLQHVRAKSVIIPLIYIFILILSPIIVRLLALIGLIDSACNLRNYFPIHPGAKNQTTHDTNNPNNEP